MTKMTQGGSSDKAISNRLSVENTIRSLWTASMKVEPPKLKESDILIGVMGMTGVGKTSFVRQITGLDLTVGHGLDSCTKEVHLATVKIGDSVVRFIDTPGFDDTDTKDSDILNTIWEYISTEDLRLSGLLYLHRITDDRVGGTALKNLGMFRKLVGDHGMKNVILVTTMWGKLRQSDDGEARVKELTKTGKFWGGMISSGAIHKRYDGTKEDALRIVQMMLPNEPIKLQIQQEHENGTRLADTAAGKEVAGRLHELKAHHVQEMAELKEQLSLATQKGNEKLKHELQALKDSELKQQREIAEAQNKLQEAGIKSLQERLAELEARGSCVVS